MSKPTPPANVTEAPKKQTNRFRMDAMPPSYQAAGRIIQILTALDMPDAEQALLVVNQMFGNRKSMAEKPPHVPE